MLAPRKLSLLMYPINQLLGEGVRFLVPALVPPPDLFDIDCPREKNIEDTRSYGDFVRVRMVTKINENYLLYNSLTFQSVLKAPEYLLYRTASVTARTESYWRSKTDENASGQGPSLE
ncbi:uncharacterized protein LOC143252890 [Tachypleus tridentatus]|uniref:uncharacterized protein LOC143252890 n=1 Tax=Tachypleus tridentatus TaxID=6853 RepID=UPI003FCF23E2